MFSGSIDHPHIVQSISFALSLIPVFGVFALIAAAQFEQRSRGRSAR